MTGTIVIPDNGCILFRPDPDHANRWTIWTSGTRHLVANDGSAVVELPDGSQLVSGDKVAAVGQLIA